MCLTCCCCCRQPDPVPPRPTDPTDPPDPVVEVKLETWENDNRNGPYRVFYRDPGPGRVYVGNYSDLDNSDVEWNDIIRSVILHGPPGTAVWLYDSKNFGTGDDILEIRVPDNRTNVIVNTLDTNPPPAGVRWINHKNGIAGKVSGIRWVDGVLEADRATLKAGPELAKAC